MLDWIVVILIIAAAVVYLGRRFYRWAHQKACGGCRGGASSGAGGRPQKLTVGKT